MISKPLATISKFSGMSDNGGTFYIDGFDIKNDNGVQSLDERYLASEAFNTSTTGFTNLGDIKAIAYFYQLANSNITGGYPLRMLMNSSSKFFTRYPYSAGGKYEGEIGGVGNVGAYIASSNPDIFTLNSGNFIYTSAYHLGLLVRGKCKSSSSTTKIVDSAGRDFTNFGVSATAPNNKVTNLITGAQYTITSITTTDSTNDTLNFDAGTANSENDEFVVFVNTFKTLALSSQFTGQQTNSQWARPIRQYGDQYMIGNGNYIALLANDEDTFDATYKQLPTGYQLLAFEPGPMDQILVSAFDKQGNSYLLLWDGYNEGWNEILPVSRAPQALKPYKSGWVFMSDSVIYFTDGRTITEMISHPDKELSTKINPEGHNSIAIIVDEIYFAVNRSNLHRQEKGVLVFNINNGLSFFKCKSVGTGFASPQCVYVNNNVQTTSFYSTNNRLLDIGCNSSLNTLSSSGRSTSSSDYKSVMFYLDFQQDTQVKEVWLNLKRAFNNFFSTRAEKNTTISVNYGNGDAPVIKYGQMATGTTTTISNTNGATLPGVVGEEIEITGSSSSNAVTGQRTFITSIANPGTSSEVWTVSPALSTTTASSAELRVWGVKNSETKTITLDELSSPIRFNTQFRGSKMWLEIVVRGTTNSFPVSIDNIQIF